MTDTLLAQLSGLKASVDNMLKIDRSRIDSRLCWPLINNARELLNELKSRYSELYEYIIFDLDVVQPVRSNDYQNNFNREDIVYLASLLDMAVQTWTSQNARIIEQNRSLPKRIFISHGRSEDWRQVQRYLENDLKYETMSLQQESNKGRSILQKLYEESERCGYAVIVMSGDDHVEDDKKRARQNVVHEIGYFHGKYGLDRVCILFEEGVEIFSNIDGLVYIPYPKGYVKATFSELSKELNTASLI